MLEKPAQEFLCHFQRKSIKTMEFPGSGKLVPVQVLQIDETKVLAIAYRIIRMAHRQTILTERLIIVHHLEEQQPGTGRRTEVIARQRMSDEQNLRALTSVNECDFFVRAAGGRAFVEAEAAVAKPHMQIYSKRPKGQYSITVVDTVSLTAKVIIKDHWHQSYKTTHFVSGDGQSVILLTFSLTGAVTACILRTEDVLSAPKDAPVFNLHHYPLS